MKILVIGGCSHSRVRSLGLVIGIADADPDSTGERAIWLILTLGGALLLGAGVALLTVLVDEVLLARRAVRRSVISSSPTSSRSRRREPKRLR